MYDMDARNYMPDLARWANIDELAEAFYEWSPYNFSFNNPINFADPSGLAPEESNYTNQFEGYNSNRLTSTVVDRTGKIIDHKDDGDDNIYLGSRKGKVIGKERKDAKYELGSYLIKDDLFSNIKLPKDFKLTLTKPVELEENQQLLEVSPLLGGIAKNGLTSLRYIVYLARGGKGLKGIQYVGITSQFAIRQATHLRTKGILIEEILGGLSKADARAVEQVLIEMYKLGGKEGQTGQLLNKINSISKNNPGYAQALERGIELLKSVGL